MGGNTGRARVISVINNKGGCGKTTTAVNLAAALARMGKRVLLVDLDGQASATTWLLREEGPAGRVVYDVLLWKAKVEDCIVATQAGFDLLPSSSVLERLERVMLHEARREERLRMAVDRIAGRYDAVLIDCPPSLSINCDNALVACDEVLIPVDKQQAFENIRFLEEKMAYLKEAFGKEWDVRVVATMVDRTIVSKDTRTLLEETFSPEQLLPEVRRSTRLAEAYVARLDVFTYEPNSHGAEDYARVAAAVAGGVGHAV